MSEFTDFLKEQISLRTKLMEEADRIMKIPRFSAGAKLDRDLQNGGRNALEYALKEWEKGRKP